MQTALEILSLAPFSVELSNERQLILACNKFIASLCFINYCNSINLQAPCVSFCSRLRNQAPVQIRIKQIRTAIISQMSRAKKTNNIFNKPILPESLFYEEVQKQYTIGGVKVQGCWLSGASPPIYRASIKSALELSEMKAQYDQLREHSQTHPADVFKLAEIKQKMENFQLLDQSPTKVRQSHQWSIKADNLVLQKISKFWGLFERHCKIEGKELFVTSEKDKNDKAIDMSLYKIQLQQRGKQSKESEQFVWIEKYKDQARLYLSGKNLRPYCVYGDEKKLKSILKKMKIQSIQVKEINFFKILAKQFDQKIMVLFGNKLRLYQFLLKKKQKNDLNLALDLIEKTEIFQQVQQEPVRIEKVYHGILEQSSYANSESSMRSASILKAKQSTPVNSPISNPRTPMQNESQMRMRARRSTINYEDLENEEQVLDFKVSDFKLEIKEVTHSDEEENERISRSEQKSVQLNISQEVNEQSEEASVDSQSPQSKAQQSLLDEGKSDMGHEYVINIRPEASELDQKFLQTEEPMTHHIYIAYFEDLAQYNSMDIEFTIYQKATPEFQYENMKMPICAFRAIRMRRSENKPQMYLPKQPVLFQISAHALDIEIVYSNKVKQAKQTLQMNLSKIKYALDQSALLYMKSENRVLCAGKLKIIVSPMKIAPELHQQISTIDYLRQFIYDFEESKRLKYQFIDYKKRHLEVHQRWNNKILKRIINKNDQKQFQKAVFYGLPQEVIEKFNALAKHSKSFVGAPTIHENTEMSPHLWTTLQNQIVLMKVYDIRVFITIQKLLGFILEKRKNSHLQRRLDQLSLYFSLKYGKMVAEKFLAVYVIETLRKLEGLLLLLKSARQIEMLIEEYFEVEYEIDQLMEAIWTYFH